MEAEVVAVEVEVVAVEVEVEVVVGGRASRTAHVERQLLLIFVHHLLRLVVRALLQLVEVEAVGAADGDGEPLLVDRNLLDVALAPDPRRLLRHHVLHHHIGHVVPVRVALAVQPVHLEAGASRLRRIAPNCARIAPELRAQCTVENISWYMQIAPSFVPIAT